MDSAHRAAYEFADEQVIGSDKELIGWLAGVVQAVHDRISQQPVEDVCEIADEIAYASVPIFTHDRMVLMAASNGLACREPESTLGEACTPAQVAGLVLYEVAYDLVVCTAEGRDSEMPSDGKFHICGGCATMFDTQEDADSCFDRDCPHDEDGLPIPAKPESLDSTDSV